MAELNTEWMKFMTRISRQQNCDNADDYDDEDYNDETSEGENEVTTPSASAFACCVGSSTITPKITSAGANASASAVLAKKSCISKKAQRRTYSFLDPTTTTTTTTSTAVASTDAALESSSTLPPPVFHPSISQIYISTKTKIAYLNKPVNIYNAFWDVPVQHYYERKEGVIKKQIKFQTTDPTFIASIKDKLVKQPREGVIKKQIKFQTTDPTFIASIKDKLVKQPRYYEEYVIEHIENPNGRIPYKDQRKVSIGLCKKDLQGNNAKKKRAFFNCFVLILRINGGIASAEERAPEDDVLYKEMHVKVFNTGKLEIPGIQEDGTLIHVLRLLVTVLRPHLGDDLDFLPNRCETALINSNFNCGFYIDRDRLFQLLKYKYRMNCNYDSCSYPGIQSKFYYIPGKPVEEQSGQQPVSMDQTIYYEVSFMIFRTGSILIVGKCNEEILMVIYRFICSVLTIEYSGIQMGDIPSAVVATAGSGGDGASSNAKNNRKKRLQLANIRYYEPSAAAAALSI